MSGSRRSIRACVGLGVALWLAVSTAASRATSEQSTSDGGDEELARLEHERARAEHLALTSEMRTRMRTMLDQRVSEEAAVDRRSLLARKLSVDSALSPAVLLLELAGAGRIEPLAALRVDYSDRRLLLHGPDEPTRAAVDALGNSQESALRSGIEFEYRSWRTGAAEADFPALIHWRGVAHGQAFTVRAQWFEPFLAQRQLDFPLNPEGLLIDFTPDRASITSPFPASIVETRSFVSTAPRLRNTADLYDLFDALALASFSLRSPAPVQAGPGEVAVLEFRDVDGEGDGDGDEIPQEVRTVEWSVRSSQAFALQFWQPVLPLRHESDHLLVGEATVGGERVGGESRRPVASLLWMPSGLHGRVTLRAPDGGDRLDAADQSLDGLRFPAEITLSTRGGLLAVAHFGAFRIGAHVRDAADPAGEWPSVEARVQEALARQTSLLANTHSNSSSAARSVEPYSPSEILGDVDPLVARWRLRVNLLAAALTSDARGHDAAMDLMRRRLEQDCIPPRWICMNAQAWLEELAGPLDLQAQALALAAPAWLAHAGALPPEERLEELSRLAVSGKWGFALLLARSLASSDLPPSQRAWVLHVVHEVTPWVHSPASAPHRSATHPQWDERVDEVLREMNDMGATP